MAEQRLGLATSDPGLVRRRVLETWDDFLAIAGQIDVGRPSRLPGWSGGDVLAHLASGGEDAPLERILASARAGGAGPPLDVDADNARVVERLRGSSSAQLLAGLTASRDAVAAFFSSAGYDTIALAPAVSPIGAIPVLTVLFAGTFELTVHALDLAPCGAPEPPARMFDAALGAVTDSLGALARRSRTPARVSVLAPAGGWSVRGDADGWDTEQLAAAARPDGPVARGSAHDLLDATSGRANAASMLLRGRLRVADLRGFTALLPIVEETPAMPGGPMLRAAISVLKRVPRWARG